MTVRVRVTIVAVVVTAIALAIGGWGLLRSIESTELGRIAAAMEERVDALAERVATGDLPDGGFLADSTGLLVQVIDNRTGDVLTGAGRGERPLLVVQRRSSDGTRTVTRASSGAMRIDAMPSGPPASPSDGLELRYQQVETPDGDVTVVVASPLTEVSRSLAAVRRALRLGLPIVVVLVGLVAWVVTGRALRPVEAMRAEVEEITHSTLHRRVPAPSTSDEIGRLARTMNAMLDRLESSAEGQRRFVADASHELRTPVATLRAELEVAQRADDPGALRAGVAAALAEEGRLEVLLADLLLLAGVEEVGVDAEDEVDLGALVRQEAERERRVPVTVTVADAATIRGSRTKLGRAVANLLDNASRHAEAEVAVSVTGAVIIVDDDGPGIAEADRERVFERFCRLDEARTRDSGGSGLGLSMVQAIAHAHGGAVRVASAPELGGARLVLDLSGG